MEDRLDDPTTGEEASRRRGGQVLFALLFFGLSVVLLALIGEQTKWVARSKIYTQPGFWPAIALGGMVLFTGLHLRLQIRARAEQRRQQMPNLPLQSASLASAFTPDERREGFNWLHPFEYAAYFMIYVNAVPIIGFLISSMTFAPLLLYRFGYRKRFHLWIGVMFAIATVVMFKGFLSVKIPGALIYEILPGALRNFFILNF